VQVWVTLMAVSISRERETELTVPAVNIMWVIRQSRSLTLLMAFLRFRASHHVLNPSFLVSHSVSVCEWQCAMSI
jgi:hypothetical protein